MTPTLTRISLLALLTLLLPLGAAADDPAWLGAPLETDPQVLLAAAEAAPAPPGSDIAVLWKEVSYVFDADGKSTYRHHLIYRIVTGEGLDGWSAVSADWTPWHQDRPEIRARVIGPQGSVHPLDPSTLVEVAMSEVESNVYDDRRLLEAPLPGLRLGALVEEVVIVRDTRPFFAAGTTGVDYLIDNQPIHRGRLTLDAPISLPLRYGVRLAKIEPRRTLEGGRVRLDFDYGPTEPAEPVEVGLPSTRARYPSVAFSTGRDWTALATAYAEVVDRQLAGYDFAALAAEAPATGSAVERIDELLALVQRRVRYTGLELGARSLVPATPAETLERQFGDCKDQASLLVGLLREIGVPAYVALLNAGHGADVEARLPGLGGFNHAIVYVPAERPLWIDPTDPFARAGDLPIGDQGRFALIAAPTTEKLLLTPVSSSAENRLLEQRKIVMPEYGKATLVEVGEYHGELERTMRASTMGDADARRDAYTEYARGEYLSEHLAGFEESPPLDFSRPFSLRLEVVDVGRAVTDLDEALVAIPWNGLTSEVPEELLVASDAKRRDDYVFAMPHVIEWQYQIQVPRGMAPRNLPESGAEELGAARLEKTFELRDDSLEIRLRFDSGHRRLTPELFDATRAALAELARRDALVIFFDHRGAAQLAAGQSREAIEEFDRVAREEPKVALHQVRLARGLLAVGLGDAAARAARRAVELEPESALAHWAVGLVHLHDELGRLRGPGHDLAVARASLERAAELAPDNRLVLAELAIALEYNAEGMRFGVGTDLDAAILHHRHWRERFDDGALDENLELALAAAHDWSALLELTDELPETPSRNAFRLLALAALEGPPRALREAAVLAPSGDGQRELLAAAAQQLLLAGRYEAAAELLRKTVAGNPNPAATLHFADMLAGVRPLEEIEKGGDLEPGGPESLFRRFLITLADDDPDGTSLAPLFHRHAFAAPPTAEEWTDLHREIRKILLSSAAGVPMRTSLELGLALFEIRIDGDGEPQRLRATSRLPGYDFSTLLYFSIDPSQSDGALRILAFEGDLAPLGRDALDRLDRGDLAGARRLLDWARAELPKREVEDPLGGHPFSHLWTVGDAASGDAVGDAKAIRRAVAALLAVGDSADLAAPVLERALVQENDPDLRHWLEVALLHARMQNEDWPGLAELAAEFTAREPSSELALGARLAALEALGELDTARHEVEALFAERPDDGFVLGILSEIAFRQNRADDALELFERFKSLGETSPALLNQWAWALLFRDPVPDDALTLAQRAAQLSDYKSYAILHTLASAYAEHDRPLEAWRVLQQALDKKGDGRPGDAEWYVLGRIAESYGRAETARKLYERIKPHPGEGFLPASELAARRLRGLGKSGG